jgi:hypothetical protein
MAKAKNRTPRATQARRAATRAPDAARLQALANGARLKKVGEKEFDLSDYEAVKSAGGNSSLDNGDKLAKSLRGLGLDDVYKEAAKVLGKDEAAALYKRYNKREGKEPLNPGMQRMNLGNRMRAAMRQKGSTSKAA